jgi:hypothetical protein
MDLMPETATVTTEERIRSAYAWLIEEPGDWAALADLREMLDSPDLTREEIDATLKAMALADPYEVFIEPEANGKTLEQRDHDAALKFGGEWNHLLKIFRGSPNS